METISTSNLSQQKLEVLQHVGCTLKQEFVGLNIIIEQIIKTITPWYLFPHLQKRPLIINLWGMTGVGKTSLVKRLVELLKYSEAFYHFDMGDNRENEAPFKDFFNQLLNLENGIPFIIALDEFQYANTLNRQGHELDKSHSRVIWELLDTGKFQSSFNGFDVYGHDVKQAIVELKYILSKGIKVEKGLVTKKINYFNFLTDARSDNKLYGLYGEYKGREELLDEEGNKSKKRKVHFLSARTIDSIYSFCDGLFQHKLELKDQLYALDGEQIISYLEQLYKYALSTKELDCRKALIFILGNLDEAYHFADVINPDISADEFYNLSKSININDIKSALKSRFRNEQIARLVNNHIIYPALSKSAYQQIIKLELDKLIDQAKDSFKTSVVFDKSIDRLLYKEGVYPTQGTRPLYSTIQHLLEPSLASLPVITSSKHPDSCACKFSYKKKLLIIEFINAHGETVHKQKEQVHLQLQGLRSSKNDDLQAVTAVHEAGHAIVSALLLGILPNQILSVSTDSSSAGMVITEAKHRMVWGKEMVINKAAVCMAGLLAEKIIFGEQNITGGSESDIKTATSLIVSFVKRQGLADEAMYVDIEEAFSANAVFDNDHHCNDQVKYYLKLSQTRAEDILLYNKEIVVAIGKYLATHTTMSKNKFVSYLKCTTASGDVVDMKIPQNLSYKNILFNAAISNGRDPNIVIHPSYISLNKNVHQD